MYSNRFEVYIQDDKFIVIDEQTQKQVGKNYKYSRYAHNLQARLELENINE